MSHKKGALIFEGFAAVRGVCHLRLGTFETRLFVQGNAIVIVWAVSLLPALIMVLS